MPLLSNQPQSTVARNRKGCWWMAITRRLQEAERDAFNLLLFGRQRICQRADLYLSHDNANLRFDKIKCNAYVIGTTFATQIWQKLCQIHVHWKRNTPVQIDHAPKIENTASILSPPHEPKNKKFQIIETRRWPTDSGRLALRLFASRKSSSVADAPLRRP